ncbi:MAG: 7-carboxy-7-deazaguanine synthase QueE [Akkermansiaceae bacterium]
MLISEIFYSIQGEGSLAGVPSVFVRTSGCNLRCIWCDTPYASWNPTGKEMTMNQIMDEILAFPAHHAVLTGGEPMIAKGMHELAQSLHDAGKHITIETAGTIAPNGIACDLASLSPKLAHSTPTVEKAGAWSSRHERARWQPDVIRAWLDHCDFQMKFVVRVESDVHEIIDLLEKNHFDVPSDKILLMPEGTDTKVLHECASQVAEWCKQYGFRYTPRLHIDLYGNTMGT